MPYIRVYTKEINNDSYPDGLARSIHFSITENGKETELNRGYGILFARGEISDKGTIIPKGVRNPEIFRTESGDFEITAVRVLENGTDEERVTRIAWKSSDLVGFEELNAVCSDREVGKSGDPMVEISDEEAQKILNYWNAPAGKGLTKGKVAKGLADPVFFHRDNKWYFIFTNDNLNDIGLYIREGSSVEALLSDETPMHCILNVNTDMGLIQTFWAPEIHVIGDDIYILFAVSGEEFGPCCHMMKLKRGGNLTDAGSYEAPVPVRRMDGTVLTIPEYKLSKEEIEAIVPSDEKRADDRFGISLDATYLKDAGRSYLIWSFRQHIGTSLDSGSMLMIAEISEETPWKLISEPVLISRPLYGYENASGTINNEGPYIYRRGDMIYVNYSGGDARGYLYVINLLSAKSGSNLLDAGSWKKRVTPLCNFTTFPGAYGPGHNSWFADDTGKEWIAFHAADSIESREISVGIFEYPENL